MLLLANLAREEAEDGPVACNPLLYFSVIFSILSNLFSCKPSFFSTSYLSATSAILLNLF